MRNQLTQTQQQINCNVAEMRDWQTEIKSMKKFKHVESHHLTDLRKEADKMERDEKLAFDLLCLKQFRD